MTYQDAERENDGRFELINSVDEEKVVALANDIRENGWKGMPILFVPGSLITGSHRYAALRKIWEEEPENAVFEDEKVFASVEDIVDAAMEERGESFDEVVVFDTLSTLFEGTWVEKYADELEW